MHGTAHTVKPSKAKDNISFCIVYLLVPIGSPAGFRSMRTPCSLSSANVMAMAHFYASKP